jgi:hypothetical protein
MVQLDPLTLAVHVVPFADSVPHMQSVWPDVLTVQQSEAELELEEQPSGVRTARARKPQKVEKSRMSITLSSRQAGRNGGAAGAGATPSRKLCARQGP